MLSDWRLTVQLVATKLSMSVGSTHEILHDHLKLHRVCARWVPRILTEELKKHRVIVCKPCLSEFRQQGTAFLDSMLLGVS
jgi:histone-lysine N-methyltransferase SETMAR